MLRAHAAANILLGAFVNLSAIVEALRECERVDLLCAGTFGHVTAEDALFAGAVVERIGSGEWGVGNELNDQARLVRDAWLTTAASQTPLAAVLRECQGGRNLIAEGFDADIDTAAKIDALRLVPRYDVAAGRITA
jgi:2-phosphosulfolactate phosphatase